MFTVLITQCRQQDFADPISPHDPLPTDYSRAARRGHGIALRRSAMVQIRVIWAETTEQSTRPTRANIRRYAQNVWVARPANVHSS